MTLINNFGINAFCILCIDRKTVFVEAGGNSSHASLLVTFQNLSIRNSKIILRQKIHLSPNILNGIKIKFFGGRRIRWTLFLVRRWESRSYGAPKYYFEKAAFMKVTSCFQKACLIVSSVSFCLFLVNIRSQNVDLFLHKRWKSIIPVNFAKSGIRFFADKMKPTKLA